MILMDCSQTSREYTLKAITTKPASELTFLLEGRDGRADKMVSIPEYFKQAYNMQVNKPRLVSSPSRMSRV